MEPRFQGLGSHADGQRFDPLTVTDNYSRFLLDCRIVEMTGMAVAAAMDRLFRDAGLPWRLRMDNGSPWGSRGPAGLSRTSVQWLKLGIELEFTLPARPDQNGRHERFHETLQAETMQEPKANRGRQQQRFDEYRREYNEERPHEALGQVPPADVYRVSARAYPRRVEDPHYAGDEVEVRRVRSSGEIKWRGGLIYIGEALVGELLGLRPTEEGDHVVAFTSVDLGRIDRKTGKFRAFGPPRPGRSEGQRARTTTADVSPM